MIRALRLSDMPRQLLADGLSGGEDWAYTRAVLSSGAKRLSQVDLLRWSVLSSKSRRAVASIEDGRLLGVTLLQTRHGPGAWEIAHLFTSQDGLSRATDLLERSVSYAAQCGGERVFLRVRHRSPMQDVARRAGFMPAYTEELFVLSRAMSVPSDMPMLALRPRMPQDTYGLFRLYNATAPANARAMLGLTLDQWSDATENLGGSCREYVWEEDGQLKAWARLAQSGAALEVDAVLHPGHGGQAAALTAAVGRLAHAHSSAAWAVPNYQQALSQALQARGWEVARTYTVLARSAASRVREPAWMPVQA